MKVPSQSSHISDGDIRKTIALSKVELKFSLLCLKESQLRHCSLNCHLFFAGCEAAPLGSQEITRLRSKQVE
jgi:hypothetical protein